MPNPLGSEKFVSAVVAEKAELGSCCHENNEILGEMIAHQDKREPAHTTDEFFHRRNSIGQIVFEKTSTAVWWIFEESGEDFNRSELHRNTHAAIGVTACVLHTPNCSFLQARKEKKATPCAGKF